jgi:hypothetical protein
MRKVFFSMMSAGLFCWHEPAAKEDNEFSRENNNSTL